MAARARPGPPRGCPSRPPSHPGRLHTGPGGPGHHTRPRSPRSTGRRAPRRVMAHYGHLPSSVEPAQPHASLRRQTHARPRPSPDQNKLLDIPVRPRGGTRPAGHHSHGLSQRHAWAVLPEPFQRVVDPLLRVLDVDHDVKVVQEYPAALPLAFGAHRPGPGLAHLLLDLVHDRADLTVVRRRTK